MAKAVQHDSWPVPFTSRLHNSGYINTFQLWLKLEEEERI
jgi:hypothetical protein